MTLGGFNISYIGEIGQGADFGGGGGGRFSGKKENQIFLVQYIRKFRMEQLQSHI
jgi:hypothetical protein